LVPVTADPRIGSVPAGYRIEALLGRGGMGAVHVAGCLAAASGGDGQPLRVSAPPPPRPEARGRHRDGRRLETVKEKGFRHMDGKFLDVLGVLAVAVAVVGGLECINFAP
jgi:hypothetical protein